MVRDELLGDELRERKIVVGDEVLSKTLRLERPVLAVHDGEKRIVRIAFGAAAASKLS